MNRRGFLGLLGKLAAVGSAMGVAPALLAPIQQVTSMKAWTVTEEVGEAMTHEDAADKLVFGGKPTWTLAS